MLQRVNRIGKCDWCRQKSINTHKCDTIPQTKKFLKMRRKTMGWYCYKCEDIFQRITMILYEYELTSKGNTSSKSYYSNR